jgi:hypothetical protein
LFVEILPEVDADSSRDLSIIKEFLVKELLLRSRILLQHDEGIMDLFKKISLRLRFFWGSLFYLTYAPKAYLYSRKRDRIERDFPIEQNEDTFDKPGKLLRSEPKPRGARFYFEQAELEVSFLTPDLVRVEWFPSLPPIPYAIHRKDWSELEHFATIPWFIRR